MEGKFHPGELFVQKMIGVDHLAQRLERGISNTLTPGVQQFISNQTSIFISTLDKNSNIWTSIVLGESDFITTIDEVTLRLDLTKVSSTQEDIFFKNIISSTHIGILFIELSTRRRFRVNGNIFKKTDSEYHISVDQAYGNCPKYIQRRVKITSNQNTNQVQLYQGNLLSPIEINIIEEADTFFVGSSNKANHLDTSHRGGNKGFVQFINETTLKIPDYPGNNMYNTLGNFVERSNASLLFIDFETNSTLQLNGIASLLFYQQGKKALLDSGNTGRFWTFEITKWTRFKNHHNGNWNFEDFSPFIRFTDNNFL